MKAVLLRVGIDTGSGGILGPLFPDGAFEYIPVYDNRCIDPRTYGNTLGRHGKRLTDYFPSSRRTKMCDCPMHVDPEFETFTYGDPTSTKAGLRKLEAGDFLIFYCGLQGHGFACEPGLYLMGYFEVEVAGSVADLGEDRVKHTFANNFHVRHKQVFEEQKNRLVLVKGTVKSRLLQTAKKISTYGKDKSGRRLHVLSEEAQAMFGDFGGKTAIQRCPPRWIDDRYVEKAVQSVIALP